jgi:hypothetical protein
MRHRNANVRAAGRPGAAGRVGDHLDDYVLPNLVIRYTEDGTLPSQASPVYHAPISVSSPATFFAIASAPGCSDSPLASATYSIATPEGGSVVEYPVAHPPSGPYYADFYVTLTTPTPGATICYTLDGVTIPACDATASCTAGTQYSGSPGIPINATTTDANGNAHVLAIACKAGMSPSAVSRADYVRL